MAMNVQEIQGQWNQLKGLVKQRWAQLTDDDLRIAEGNLDQLVGLIQQKTGDSRETIERFLTDMTSRGSSAVAHAAEATGRYSHRAVDGIRDRYDMAEATVRHNPAQSVALAFGLGMLAGLIVGLTVQRR
jgi:uncharacterized protein YjbJ (UPF0337 family)